MNIRDKLQEELDSACFECVRLEEMLDEARGRCRHLEARILSIALLQNNRMTLDAGTDPRRPARRI